MGTWNKIFGPTVWGAKSSRQFRLFKTIRQTPYLIGAAVSYAARSDGPSVFEGAPFTSIAFVETPGYVRRNWANQDSLMEEYYFG